MFLGNIVKLPAEVVSQIMQGWEAGTPMSSLPDGGMFGFYLGRTMRVSLDRTWL